MDYNRILGKTMTCLKNSIGDIQNKERLFHGWKFNTSHLNVDLQFSPQWKEENMEDMYEYLENMNPPRRCL